MALNPDFVGRTYPAAPPYEVGREKIREFADAIGDHNPAYREPDAARALGHPDVIAPPTFPIVVSMRASAAAVFDPDLGLDYSRVVHGEQRFVFTRPVRAGDRLVATLSIESIRTRGRERHPGYARGDHDRGRRAGGHRLRHDRLARTGGLT